MLPNGFWCDRHAATFFDEPDNGVEDEREPFEPVVCDERFPAPLNLDQPDGGTVF